MLETFRKAFQIKDIRNKIVYWLPVTNTWSKF